MDESTLADYLTLVQEHPSLFLNPDKGGYQILLKENEIREVELLAVQRLSEKNLPVSWAKVGIVYQDQDGLMLRDAVRFPDGFLNTYIRFVNIESTPGVVVLPVYQNNVMLVKRFHHATRNWHFEIPRRYGAKGLSTEENARKVLMEELEVVISHLVSLGQVQPGTGISTDYDELFFAYVESDQIRAISETSTELLCIPIGELERLICENAITDSFTIVAYTRAKLHGLC